MEINEREIAKQMTILESFLFCSITEREWLEWGKKGGKVEEGEFGEIQNIMYVFYLFIYLYRSLLFVNLLLNIQTKERFSSILIWSLPG